MSKVVCVTGMHRSGTSLLASWLQEQGLKIDSGGLVSSSVGNKKGHFEDKEIMKFQSKLILESNPRSKGWIVDNSIKVDHFNVQVLKILENRNNIKQWGWKDPRSSLLLNYWNESIKDLKYVFIWRKADEVVASLLKRKYRSKHELDQISKRKCFSTWMFYNKVILEFYKANVANCVLINLNDLMDNDEKVFNEIVGKLKIELHYKKLDNILDSSMFTKTSSSTLSKLYSYYYNVKALEEELLKFSMKV